VKLASHFVSTVTNSSRLRQGSGCDPERHILFPWRKHKKICQAVPTLPSAFQCLTLPINIKLSLTYEILKLIMWIFTPNVTSW